MQNTGEAGDFRLTVRYSDQQDSFDVEPNLPIPAFFDRLSRRFGITAPASDFVFFVGTIIPISPAPVSLLHHPDPGVIPCLLPAADAARLESFGTTILPSLVSELCLARPLHNEIISTIRLRHSQALAYPDPELQALCASLLPDHLLNGADLETGIPIITAWFQQEFFKFVWTPPCRICGTADHMDEKVKLAPSVSDLAGNAPRVEGFHCRQCGAMTRFPRYYKVEPCLKTRFGRCGEFANVFAAMLTAYGADVRLVWDFADHIWVDYWSESRGYYCHVDPCENKIDMPLLYEEGWGKDLRLVVAISATQVVDVTRRYVGDYARVLPKRAEVLDEGWVSMYLRFQG
jgi:peptide-N4-(N-acetyl-beta-glucosaminyl)asparagine amidase